jgi:hypothetical protein
MKGGQVLMMIRNYHQYAMYGMLGVIDLLLPPVTGSQIGI